MLETSGSKKKNVLITVFNGVKYIVYIIQTIFEQWSCVALYLL